jgi:hypothetical protein
MITEYKKYVEFVDYFQVLYENAPNSLKIIIDQCKNIDQSKIWHPEGNVYNHIKIVTNRLYNYYNDINLTLAGFFHDLGKVKTTFWDSESLTWRSPSHEFESVIIIKDYKDWIIKNNGDFELIKYIVLNHMKIKYLDGMKFPKLIEIIDNVNIDYVIKFSTADYGGNDIKCMKPLDISEIKNKINNYKILQKKNEIISSKFNGKIVMNIRPELKGKELGQFIKIFKDYYGDEYIIKTDIKILNQDIKNFNI